MIECELKKGVPTDLYYLNRLIHDNFDNLIDCANSKSEMLTSKIKVRTRQNDIIIKFIFITDNSIANADKKMSIMSNILKKY